MDVPVVTSPQRGATIIGNTVTVKWDTVPGAAQYRVKLYYGWETQIYKKDVGNATQVTFTDLPTGIYQYRVYAYGENRFQDDVDLDNFSVTTFSQGAMDWFVIPPLVTAPSGDINDNGYLDIGDAVNAMQIATGIGDIDPSFTPGNGDVAPFGNPDGKISIGDAHILLKGILGNLDWNGRADLQQ